MATVVTHEALGHIGLKPAGTVVGTRREWDGREWDTPVLRFRPRCRRSGLPGAMCPTLAWEPVSHQKPSPAILRGGSYTARRQLYCAAAIVCDGDEAAAFGREAATIDRARWAKPPRGAIIAEPGPGAVNEQRGGKASTGGGGA